MSQVYIFDFGDRLKIGYSTNVRQRLSAIESTLGAKAKQVYSVDGSRQIEQAALYHLRDNLIRGEFFNCDFETAKRTVDGIASGAITVPPNAKSRAAKKRANNKWDSENMTTLACKVKRSQAAAFKAYCDQRGKTSNAVLRDHVLACISAVGPLEDAINAD